MTRHVAIQAPINDSESVELAANSRIFRKEVLRVGKIKYKGDVLDFTSEYLDGLALAHKDQVFPVVPLVFAPDDNRHTQDIERIRGEVLGFERNGDALHAIIRASNDKAATLLRENPKISCSVRIEQPIDRADGKSWPAAIQHVLATANPVVPGLAPWQPVDLAVDELPVIDLSIYDFADGEDEENIMADKPVPLSDEETARLRQLLAQLEGTEVADETPAEDDGYTLPSDDELAQLAASLLADDEDDEVVQDELPVEVAVSSDNRALELANRVDAQAIELATLRAERDAERYARLRDELAHKDGIPPHITELAKPLLLGRNVVELSSGASVDAGETILKVMKALATSRLVDLSNGVVYDTPKSAQDDSATRESEVADYLKTFGLR